MANAVSAVETLPFSSLKGFPELFTTYCTDYTNLSQYYRAQPYRPEAWKEVADSVTQDPRQRAEVVDLLAKQNEQWGLDRATRSNLEQLRNDDALAVVTGQQIGLFGGPLFTFYKVITTLQLAERVQRETGRPTVPIFWMAGEDHDFEEIAQLCVIHRNQLVHLDYSAYRNPSRPHPVGRLRLNEGIEKLLNDLDTGLLDTEFKPGLLEMVRECYASGRTLVDAFAQLINRVFSGTGLILVSPDDPGLKELCAPLFRQEIQEYGETYRRLKSVSDDLAEEFHVQVHPQRMNLFLMEDEGRYALVPTGEGSFKLRGLDRSYSESALLDVLENEPARFSPNVVMRPLMQDRLFPTLAYVAGPSELSYFGQMKPLYEHFGVPMPLIYPRASVSVIEGKVARVLDRYKLSIPDLQQDFGALFKQVILHYGDIDVEEVFGEAGTEIHKAINRIKPVIEEVDKTLISSTEATRTNIIKELGHLQDKVVRAQKRNHDEIRDRLDKAQVGLFPERSLQERMLSPLYFLNKYSLDLVDDWQEKFSLDTTRHQIMHL